MRRLSTLLIVEDDGSWRDLYAEIFEQEGCTVHLAASKEEALAELRRHRFDAAVIDIRLVDREIHNSDGIQLVEIVRAMYAELPVIVNSGYLTTEILRQLRVLGVFDVFDKSEFSGQELLATIAKAIP